MSYDIFIVLEIKPEEIKKKNLSRKIITINLLYAKVKVTHFNEK